MLFSFLRKTDASYVGEPELILPSDLPGSVATPAASDCLDLSYEDALFDRDLRSLVHAEYDTVEPPAVSYKLFKAIEERAIESRPVVAPAQPTRSSLLPTLTQSLLNLYRGRRGTNLARLLPSGVILLLLFSALGPSLSHLLNDRTIANTTDETSNMSRRTFINPKVSDLLGGAGSESNGNIGSTGSNDSSKQTLYDPTYDDPATWTPLKISQTKFNTPDTTRRNDTRTTNPGPE